MSEISRTPAVLAAALAVGLSVLGGPAAQAAERASATLLDAAGTPIGTVHLAELGAGGVHLFAEAQGLPAGVHAFHIHAVGDCDPATGFKSAGGHYAPRGNLHGWKVPGGPHAGDLPNVHVQDDEVLAVEYFTPLVTLVEGAEATLFDADGSSIVIHAGADDYESQPSGAAGPRIACGVIVAE